MTATNTEPLHPADVRDRLAALLPDVYVGNASTLDLADRPHAFVQINLTHEHAAALADRLVQTAALTAERDLLRADLLRCIAEHDAITAERDQLRERVQAVEALVADLRRRCFTRVHLADLDRALAPTTGTPS